MDVYNSKKLYERSTPARSDKKISMSPGVIVSDLKWWINTSVASNCIHSMSISLWIAVYSQYTHSYLPVSTCHYNSFHCPAMENFNVLCAIEHTSPPCIFSSIQATPCLQSFGKDVLSILRRLIIWRFRVNAISVIGVSLTLVIYEIQESVIDAL